MSVKKWARLDLYLCWIFRIAKTHLHARDMFLALEKFGHFMIQTFATNLHMKPNKKEVTV